MHTPNELAPLTGKLETHVQDAVDKTSDLRDRATATLRTAKKAIAEASASTAETLKGAAVSTDEYVRENPWIAVGVTAIVAAAAGYLFGVLSAPRTRGWSKN